MFLTTNAILSLNITTLSASMTALHCSLWGRNWSFVHNLHERKASEGWKQRQWSEPYTYYNYITTSVSTITASSTANFQTRQVHPTQWTTHKTTVVQGVRWPTCAQGRCKLYYTLQIHPDKFRQLTAIFRGLRVPRTLLQYCLCFGWLWIMVRSVWPAAAAVNCHLQGVTRAS
jgi:hypothetical protein